jgi:hypothetical protein
LIGELRSGGVSASTDPKQLSSQQVVRLHQLLHEVGAIAIFHCGQFVLQDLQGFCKLALARSLLASGFILVVLLQPHTETLHSWCLL